MIDLLTLESDNGDRLHLFGVEYEGLGLRAQGYLAPQKLRRGRVFTDPTTDFRIKTRETLEPNEIRVIPISLDKPLEFDLILD